MSNSATRESLSVSVPAVLLLLSPFSIKAHDCEQDVEELVVEFCA